MERKDQDAAAALEPATIELPASDGRTLTACLYGPDEGVPVLFHYGTPGSRLLAPQAVRAAERRGVRLLVVDRPGYGGSSRRPGRRAVDIVQDVARLADALGWDRFATWGGSGGAPHALACAALLGHRVRRCASVVGPAPFDAEGLDWFAGMSAGNVEEFTRARESRAKCHPVDNAGIGGKPLAQQRAAPLRQRRRLQRASRGQPDEHAVGGGVEPVRVAHVRAGQIAEGAPAQMADHRRAVGLDEQLAARRVQRRAVRSPVDDGRARRG